jgi:hypothetical protein
VKHNLGLDRYFEFEKLSDARKIQARIAWLEGKMVEVIRLLISLISALFGGLVA